MTPASVTPILYASAFLLVASTLLLAGPGIAPPRPRAAVERTWFSLLVTIYVLQYAVNVYLVDSGMLDGDTSRIVNRVSTALLGLAAAIWIVLWTSRWFR